MNKTIVVEAGKSEKSYWKDIWTYRELLMFLAWRGVMYFRKTEKKFADVI